METAEKTQTPTLEYELFLAEEGVTKRDVTGRFTLLERIGNGAMGVVYKARDEDTSSVVAVKAMWPHLAENDRYRKRFDREQHVLRVLSHPNIVRYYGALELDDKDGNRWPAYARQYLSGMPLRKIMEREENRLPLPLIARITAHVAQALHYVHEKGLVVRDIKADDIILEKQPPAERVAGEATLFLAMLFDFGIVTRRHDGDQERDKKAIQAYHNLVGQNYEAITHPGSIMGTPAYMSPEHVDGYRLDGRTDLYALGVTLYCLLARRLPFTGGTPNTLFPAILYDVPPPFQDTSSLDHVCLKLLEKHPDDRYQTGQEVVDAVRDAVPEMDAPIATTVRPTNGKIPIHSLSEEPRKRGYRDELVKFFLTPAEWIFGDRTLR